jgi:hypothetical protein
MKIIALFVILSASLAVAQHQVPLKITWTPSGDPPEKFLIQRSNTSGGPYTPVCDGTGQPACPTAAASAAFTDTDPALVGGQTVYYVGRASGPGGLGPISSELKTQVNFLPPTTAPSLSPAP